MFVYYPYPSFHNRLVRSQIYILYMAIITSIAIFYLCIPRYAGVGYFWSTLKKIKVILSLFSVFSSQNLITILEVQLNKYAKLFSFVFALLCSWTMCTWTKAFFLSIVLNPKAQPFSLICSSQLTASAIRFI